VAWKLGLNINKSSSWVHPIIARRTKYLFLFRWCNVLQHKSFVANILIFFCWCWFSHGLVWSIMHNSPLSPPSSFFLPKQVEQEAFHSIMDKANYEKFMTSRNLEISFWWCKEVMFHFSIYIHDARCMDMCAMSSLKLGSLKLLICFGMAFNALVFFECVHTNCANVNAISNND
jgi:hypothetical protein